MNFLFYKFVILILINYINCSGVFNGCVNDRVYGVCDLSADCPRLQEDVFYCDDSLVCCPPKRATSLHRKVQEFQ